ncbi:glutathione-specific gamma-glutamylcyclotransferase 1-like isoform X1 [Micropterus dolomieu]|uniref:glutathione-specific gamma-glutamylcyclotransferase 1-like isoform X1 n=1 Tax=Micropterus dolomieu TaxID=147949 RepID=UPI001E8E4BF6|nr:glutathione-specific gamma-glutamylcyclotransferase 1-like isoform X1 [Micropterus dolomieu]
MKPQDIIKEKSSLWIFGYGSLVWKPDFDYKRSKIGCIKGYKRRFWHGDDFYRGDKKRPMCYFVLCDVLRWPPPHCVCPCCPQPGRVVTLVEDQDACTWGVAYEVTDSQIEVSLQYLNMREVVLGGYITEMVEFIPKEKDQAPLLALVYIATSENPIYLGPASDKEIAAQIAVCRGNTGHNIEYLVRLAEFMRLCCPGVEDDHLFSIEAAVLDTFRDCGGIKPPDQKTLLLGAT